MVAAFLAVIAQVLQTGLAALAATSTEASRGLCSRNGVSRPDGCLCDAAWTGPDCSQLALLPAPGEVCTIMCRTHAYVHLGVDASLQHHYM